MASQPDTLRLKVANDVLASPRRESLRISAAFAVACLVLLSLTIVPVAEVFGATYDEEWFIFAQNDSQRRHFADIRILYSFPDSAKAGSRFEVDVSLTYVKNTNSRFDWMEFYDVAVNLRKSATGENLVSEIDNSRVKVDPGGQYAHKFTVSAPRDLGEHWVLLTFMTTTPEASAYGLTIGAGSIISWDTGRDVEENLKKIAIERGEAVLTIRLENVPNATVRIDGQNLDLVDGRAQITLLIGGQHSVELPTQVESGEGARALFEAWSDGNTSNPRQITLTDDIELLALYKIQYLLQVLSDHGNPRGGGWYDSGSEATFSVDSPQPEAGFLGSLGGKLVFQRWTRDSSADSGTATIRMDGPKEVEAEWRTDDSQPYLILGGIVAAISAGVGLLIVLRKTRAPPTVAPLRPVKPAYVPPPPPARSQKPPPATVAPTRPTRPPPSETPGPPPGMKFCVHCGVPIPQNARFCTNINCGLPQQ